MTKFNINWKDIWLTHESPELFYGPQCKIPLWIFTIYRFVVGGYMLSIITFNQVYKFDRTPNPFTFASNWNVMFQAVALCIKAIVTVYVGATHNWKRPDQLDLNASNWKMSWYLKMEWVFHNVSSVIPFASAYGYWPGYKYQKWKLSQEFFFFFTVQIHGLTAIVALIDILLGSIPTRLLHVFHSILFSLIYLAFTGIYYAATGGELIYPNLNWAEAGMIVTYIGNNLCLVVVIHILVWFVKNMQTTYFCRSLTNKQKHYSYTDIIDEETTLLVH